MNKISSDLPEYFLSQLGPEHIDGVLALENLIFTTPWSKEQYAGLMRAGVCKVFGASEGGADGAVVAYVSASVNSAAFELEIYNVAVHPAARRRGLARRLTGLVLEAGRSLGLERALLEVRESNIAARSLYEGLGFRQCGLRRSYYAEPNEDAVLYEYLFL